MKTILIILGIIMGLGVLRIIFKPFGTFKENFQGIFFIDLIIDLFYSVMDFFDIDID